MPNDINDADFRESPSAEYLKEHLHEFPGLNFDIIKTSLLYLKILKLTMKKLRNHFDSFNISPGKLTEALNREDRETFIKLLHALEVGLEDL